MNPSMIVVHCSDTKASQDVEAKDIRKWHVEENGWSDIGYHVVITRQGIMQLGRPFNVIGAHAYGFNRESLGICMVGGRGEDGRAEANFTFDQYEALRSIVRYLKITLNVETVLGHRDLPGVTKACPCFDVVQLLGE